MEHAVAEDALQFVIRLRLEDRLAAARQQPLGMGQIAQHRAEVIGLVRVGGVVDLQPAVGRPDRRRAAADAVALPRAGRRGERQVVSAPVQQVGRAGRPDRRRGELALVGPMAADVQAVDCLGEDAHVFLRRREDHAALFERREVHRRRQRDRHAHFRDGRVGNQVPAVDERDPRVLAALGLVRRRRINRRGRVEGEVHPVSAAGDSQVRHARKHESAPVIPRSVVAAVEVGVIMPKPPDIQLAGVGVEMDRCHRAVGGNRPLADADHQQNLIAEADGPRVERAVDFQIVARRLDVIGREQRVGVEAF